jgi:phosphatidylglycerophosphate synthase
MAGDVKDRRPLASRNTRWAQATARWLAEMAITPNQISQGSMLAALAAGGAFWIAGASEGGVRVLALACAALCCQLRLLCNLFDGMVAVESRKGEPDGPFWNEFPDRVADLLILVGAGFGVGLPSLGWAAASFAIFTAYVRELGRAAGLPSDFSGPMAKQHRMATMTTAALLSTFEPLWGMRGEILTVALAVVAVGSVATVIRRSSHLVSRLRK